MRLYPLHYLICSQKGGTMYLEKGGKGQKTPLGGQNGSYKRL
jgi:hypothetical protein